MFAARYFDTRLFFCETCAATKLRDKLHDEVVGFISTENFEGGFAVVPRTSPGNQIIVTHSASSPLSLL